MSDIGRTPLRYLSAADVRAAMPALPERLALAELAMVALVNDAELPAKIGVHPRPDGSFAHAMPALLRGPDPSGADDRLGVKWVSGFGAGNTERGLPAIHALVLLNDPQTGEPSAILDGGPITAERTAAVSGLAIARYAPSVTGRPARAAIIGAGVQGHSHVAVLGHVLPGVELVVHDRHPERAEALAALANGTAGIAAARAGGNLTEALANADVVISAASFTTPERRGTLDATAFTPDALVVAVDYATLVGPSVARSAAWFLTDDRGQFLMGRDAGLFDGYPEPSATIGEAIAAGTARPPSGRVLVTHLGVGLADVVFADAVVRRATALGLGSTLPR